MNPVRGMSAVEIGGKTYPIAFTINALCEAEAEARKPIPLISQEMMLGSVTAMRLVLWAGLRGGGAGDLSLKDAGDLVGDLLVEKGVTEASRVIGEALALAFPDAAGAAAEGEGQKKTKAGSGVTSSRTS